MKILLGLNLFILTIFSTAASALTISVLQESPSSQIYSEILKKIYQHAGVPLDFVVLPTGRSLVQSSNGHIDGELVRIYQVGDLYPTLIRVPTPYTFFESTAFSKIPDVPQEEGWNALIDYRVGMVRGMKHAEIGLRDVDTDSVVEVTITKQLFDMLEYGRIDVAVTSKVSGLFFINKYDLQPLYPLEPTLQRHDLYHYLHEKNKKYVPILDKAIREMKESGELERLKDRLINKLIEAGGRHH